MFDVYDLARFYQSTKDSAEKIGTETLSFLESLEEQENLDFDKKCDLVSLRTTINIELESVRMFYELMRNEIRKYTGVL